MTADDPGRELAKESIAGAAAALLGIATGHPDIGAIVAGGSFPMIRQSIECIEGEWRDRAERRGAALLLQAGDSSGMDSGDFVGRAMSTDAGQYLAGLALQAAVRSRYPWKVLVLGRALAEGVLADDDAIIDRQALVIAAVADIERPHLCVLDLMANQHREIESLNMGAAAPAQLARRAPGRDAHAWTEKMIAAYLPRVAPVLASVLGPLERHALVDRQVPWAQAFGQYSRGTANETRRTGRAGTRPSSAGLQVDPADILKVTSLGEDVARYFAEAGATFGLDDDAEAR